MKQILLNVLETFGYPVYLHGTLGENEPFPPAFFTFQTITSSDIAFDNQDCYAVYGYQVFFYANDPQTVESIAAQSRTALKQAGFIADGRGVDIPSDEPTHTGWVTEYHYIKEDNNLEEP